MWGGMDFLTSCSPLLQAFHVVAGALQCLTTCARGPIPVGVAELWQGQNSACCGAGAVLPFAVMLHVIQNMLGQDPWKKPLKAR